MGSHFGNIVKQSLPEPLIARLQAVDHWFNGEPELRLVKRLCSRTRTAVDVGANIGTYTFFLRRYARRVVAYEPNPQLAARLARLYPGTVTVRHAAVSDHPGQMVLRLPVRGGTAFHELASISQSFSSDTEVLSFDVKTVRLDDEVLDDVGFIKVDVEQHECAVLHGALETIERCRPYIMSEATPLLYEAGLVAQFRFLTDLGYQGWFTVNKRVFPFEEFDAAIHANVANFGTSGFISPNVFFFPQETNGRQLLTS